MAAGDGTHTILSPAVVQEEAERAGLDLAVACTVLILESSGGRNIYGRDATRVPDSSLPYTKGGEVTKANYEKYKALRGTQGYQGVGPCQLTFYSFQDDADSKGGCYDPRINMRVGFAILADYVKRHGVELAFARYNGGTATANAYSAKAMPVYRNWSNLLNGK